MIRKTSASSRRSVCTPSSLGHRVTLETTPPKDMFVVFVTDGRETNFEFDYTP